jgi:hypothetical protein
MFISSSGCHLVAAAATTAAADNYQQSNNNVQIDQVWRVEGDVTKHIRILGSQIVSPSNFNDASNSINTLFRVFSNFIKFISVWFALHIADRQAE